MDCYFDELFSMDASNFKLFLPNLNKIKFDACIINDENKSTINKLQTHFKNQKLENIKENTMVPISEVQIEEISKNLKEIEIEEIHTLKLQKLRRRYSTSPKNNYSEENYKQLLELTIYLLNERNFKINQPFNILDDCNPIRFGIQHKRNDFLKECLPKIKRNTKFSFNQNIIHNGTFYNATPDQMQFIFDNLPKDSIPNKNELSKLFFNSIFFNLI